MNFTLQDFGLSSMKVPPRYDNKRNIDLSEVYIPFAHKIYRCLTLYCQGHIAKKDLIIEFFPTNQILDDIFTKPLPEQHFTRLR